MNASTRGILWCGLLAAAITVQAAAPVANDDSYTTASAQNLVVAAPGVLANDTDADPGTTLTAAATSMPGNGTLTLNADGSFTYAPDGGFYGSDSFSYEANDGTSSSNMAVVTLTVTAPMGGYGGGGGGSGYGSGGALSPVLLALFAVLALYSRGLKRSKRRAISP
jgi:VCBS repeat-containing protein